jgi:hypothetical protein
VVKVAFCVACKVGEKGVWAYHVFDAHTFNLQASLFNLTIVHNYEAIISENVELNLVTRMCERFQSSTSSSIRH